MKISDLILEQPTMPGMMGDDPVEAMKDQIKQKEEQKRALDKEIADLKANLPQVMQQQQAQQAQAAQQQQAQQQQRTSTAAASAQMPTMPTV